MDIREQIIRETEQGISESIAAMPACGWTLEDLRRINAQAIASAERAETLRTRRIAARQRLTGADR
jgi:hypothetical protein